jgi:hypothetical protein
VEGGPVITTQWCNGYLVAKLWSANADGHHELFLELDGSGRPGMDGNPANDLFLFDNHSLRAHRALGRFGWPQELVFRLHVDETGLDFYTGPGARNPDQLPHAIVYGLGPWLVGFEAQTEGPSDYNDFVFSVPETLSSGFWFALAATGTVMGARRRRAVGRSA